MLERLQKSLAAAGLGSRRTCEQWIREGRVSVDGQVVTALGSTADPAVQRIALNGRVIPRAPSRHTYIVVNKPRGYASTLADDHAGKLVGDLVDLPGKPMLRPVGRLDIETEGLLFLSDDGDFIFHLTHPKFHVEKIYLATVRGTPTGEELDQLREGVRLDDGYRARADRVRVVKVFPKTATSDVEIVVHEGRNRLIRRMLSGIGHPVARLVRTKVAFITIGALPSGAWRHLTPAEVDRLMKSAPKTQAESQAAVDSPDEAPASVPARPLYRVRTTSVKSSNFPTKKTRPQSNQRNIHAKQNRPH